MSLYDDFDEKFFSRCSIPRAKCKKVIRRFIKKKEKETHLSRCMFGTLFLRLTTDEPSALAADDGTFSFSDVDNGGLKISFIFGLIVVEKLRPRAIEPNIKLKSSAFGLTGAACCDKCNLLPITNDVRGDSTSFGSASQLISETLLVLMFPCK